MKRKALFAGLALVVFCICFTLVWKVVRVFVEDIPGLTFAAGGLCVVISGTITGWIIRDLMNVPRKD